MESQTFLERGRRAAAERRWRDAHRALAAARASESLEPTDFWWFAASSYLVGEERDFVDALTQAYHAFREADEALEAVRAAFWMGQHLASRGDLSRASGWFGRAARVVEDRRAEGAARGYALLPEAHRQLAEGHFEASVRTNRRVAEIGRSCRDGDLRALAVHGEGRALLRLGRLDHGLALLDEAMVAVVGDELTPVATGLIYCSVIAACSEVHALGRAREWTTALTEWCERQPDMIAYSGPCRVFRADILTRSGDWARAAEEAQLAIDRYARGSGPGSAGPAFYQQGELHRLMGEYAAAEDAYVAAGRAGREPQPGLALLRLAQGDDRAAAAALRRALAETRDPLRRARLLPALVEAQLDLGDASGAEQACDELDRIARVWTGPVLDAVAAQARGATLLLHGDAEGALPSLRRACQAWDVLDAPYDAARVRVLLSRACATLGDVDGAGMELANARATFERLGAAPDLARARAAAGSTAPSDHGLTPREREVIACLATGATNRAIAEDLFISEKTVARHVANIYAKLGLSTRSAATAYAYEHDLARLST